MSSKAELQQLVQAAREGDVRSFAKLYEQHYAGLVWLAYSVLGDRNLAEDAAQEAFAVACEQLDRLRRPDRFAGWLAAICRNLACQILRDRKKHVPDSVCPDVAEAVSDNSRQQIVQDAIDRLPPSYKEALFLRYYEGMNYDQMSSILGVSRSKVKGRLFRARVQVGRQLKKNGLNR